MLAEDDADRHPGGHPRCSDSFHAQRDDVRGPAQRAGRRRCQLRGPHAERGRRPTRPGRNARSAGLVARSSGGGGCGVGGVVTFARSSVASRSRVPRRRFRLSPRPPLRRACDGGGGGGVSGPGSPDRQMLRRRSRSPRPRQRQVWSPVDRPHSWRRASRPPSRFADGGDGGVSGAIAFLRPPPRRRRSRRRTPRAGVGTWHAARSTRVGSTMPAGSSRQPPPAASAPRPVSTNRCRPENLASPPNPRTSQRRERSCGGIRVATARHPDRASTPVARPGPAACSAVSPPEPAAAAVRPQHAASLP